VAAHRAAMKSALGDQFLVSCQQLTVAELKCGLAAGELRDATACAKSKSK
jgi:hypothetical protein